MKDNSVTKKIRDYYALNSSVNLSYNELFNVLQLSKKEKGLLSDALAELLNSGTLRKERKKYQLVNQTKSVQFQNSTRNARTAFRPSPTSINPNLIEGVFDATPLSRNFSFAFVRGAEKDYFIGAEDTLNAYHNDVVAIETKVRRGNQEYGIIRKIVKRFSENLAGDLVKMGTRWTFVCSNPKIHNWFEVTDTMGAIEGEKVILTVLNWGNPISGKAPIGKVTEVLGKSGDPQVELISVIRQYNLPLDFPDNVLEAANKLSDVISPSVLNKRFDLRDKFTFTIDPASAKDFDDAISIETIDNGWRLFVHIADVAHYLPIGGDIFTEAAKRGNSFYFPKKVIPMLPERLSNGICSLRPQEDKLCMTVETEFNKKGKVIAQTIYESVICSDARLAYEEVDALFASAETMEKAVTSLSPSLVEALYESRKLSRLLT
ncbi:MAG: RNB domain-containing ribonuclease, partial [Candidatus Cloacimonetes bacterium]|nr:RNB domain-containing ribonuclease [Candidatus Cloacimonadota bacterium]